MNQVIADAVKVAPIYEFKLSSGDTVIGELLDDSGPTVLMYYPLKIETRNGGHFMAAWFYSNKELWINVKKNMILCYSECDDNMKASYIRTTLKLDGIDDVVEEVETVSNDLYH